MNIIGWILWWVVFLLALSWAFSARVDASRGRNLTLTTCIQTFFWWLIAALFYFTTLNKLHILWLAPVSLLVAITAPNGLIPILSQIVIFAAERFMSVLLIGVGAAKLGQAVEDNYSPGMGFLETYALANKGIVSAQLGLGNMYAKGQGVDQDDAEAEKWWRKAAEQNNAEAIKWWRKEAVQGDASAQRNLGRMYLTGNGVEKDCVEAVKWYRKAADQGNVLAQFDLGRIYAYFDCKGVGTDYTEAAKWSRKAAEQGNAYAQHDLGNMYAKGQGVDQDEAKAEKWWRKAAEQRDAESIKWWRKEADRWRKEADQGDAAAAFSLGRMYFEGNGGEKDYAEAAKWYRKVADQGDAVAQYNLGCIY